MTKTEFVDQVADRSGVGKGDAGKAVDAALDTITEVLSRGGEISFTGFGKFSVSERGARQGVQPTDRRADPDRGEQGAPLQRAAP